MSADLPAALAELFRTLRPGGRAVIMETDYDSLVWNTENQERMDRIIAAWLHHSPHYRIPRKLTRHLKDAGFTVRHRETMPLFNPEYHSNTFSYQMSGIIAAYVTKQQGIAKEESDAWLAEFDELEKCDSYFFSLNRYLFVAERPG